MLASSLISLIEATAPLTHAASWDRSGTQIAGTRQEIRRIAVCLDPTRKNIEEAVSRDADFILCHHPVTLSPRLPDRLDNYHHILRTVLGSGCWLYAAHTSLDAAPQGPATWLGRELRLENTRVLQPSGAHTLIAVHITSATGLLLTELHNMSPVLFTEEHEDHIRFAVWDDQWAAVRQFLHERDIAFRASPSLEPCREYGLGSIGDLPLPLTPEEFEAEIVHRLGLPIKSRSGFFPERISRVAYCPGSGADLAAKAFKGGAEVYLTGDVKYHQAQEVMSDGIILDVGHFSLEERMMSVWESELRRELAHQGVETLFLPGKDPLQS
ncbi:MAG TPA: Nif3-like dinuclear metal center hexameric protein [Desulfomicrobiaceae bacterium]|nr:Nif3-like dinuclear metal center hexameric protein [Desulfomicrobiaceae bacterium]